MKSNLPFSSSSNESKVFRLDGHEQLVLQDRLAGVERDVQPEKTVKRIKKCSTIVLESPTRASSVQTSGDFTYYVGIWTGNTFWAIQTRSRSGHAD